MEPGPDPIVLPVLLAEMVQPHLETPHMVIMAEAVAVAAPTILIQQTLRVALAASAEVDTVALEPLIQAVQASQVVTAPIIMAVVAEVLAEIPGPALKPAVTAVQALS